MELNKDRQAAVAQEVPDLTPLTKGKASEGPSVKADPATFTLTCPDSTTFERALVAFRAMGISYEIPN